MENTLIKKKSIFTEFQGRQLDSSDFGLSILDCQNEVAFLWDENAGCLLTQGLKYDCHSHQELRPTEQPEFEVKNIAVNASTTKLALWGTSGVAVIDLPQRFGPRLEFDNGKNQIIVKLRSISGLNLDTGTTVLQVRWSTAQFESSLLILLSNNTLCHLMLLPQDSSPIRASKIGCRPVSRLHTLAALGETAVDFCFAPIAQTATDSNGPAILLLKGNGDVCLTIDDGGNDEWPDSLPISPLPDDNYLNDACSIHALPSQPPCVIIATSRGIVYHAVLVPLDVDQLSGPLKNRKYRLLVVESILLDPGLLSTSDDFNPFPIRLVADPGHSRRYLAIHGAGVHSVVVEVLSGVQKLIEKDQTESPNPESFVNDSNIDFTSLKMPESLVECLVCSAKPLLGCSMFSYTFLALDGESQVIELPLRRIEVAPFVLYSPNKNGGSDGEGPLTLEMRKPFEERIYQLLNDSRVLPRLRLSFPMQDMPKEQLLALVVRMGNMIRKVTIPSYQEVKKILAQRVELIRSMKGLQIQEISSLEEEKASIQLSAEAFAEKVQTVLEDIEEQRGRLQKLTHAASSVKSVPSDAELRMELTVNDIESKLQGYSDTLEKLKKCRAYQNVKIQEQIESKQVALDNKQAGIIRECLATVGENISGVVAKLNELNQLMGLTSD